MAFSSFKIFHIRKFDEPDKSAEKVIKVKKLTDILMTFPDLQQRQESPRHAAELASIEYDRELILVYFSSSRKVCFQD